jgi:hypothetical protein
MTIDQRQRLNELHERLTLRQNECNRAQSALLKAEAEESEEKVTELLDAADEALT